MTTRSPNLGNLTGIRFIFALMVIIFHAHTYFGWAEFLPLWLYDITLTGYIAVNFFFILSGFILSYTYFSQDSDIPIKAFYLARFSRIYPVYLVGLLLFLPLIFFRTMPDYTVPAAQGGAALLCFLLMIQTWIPIFSLVFNGQSWSLSAEAFFYACFPFLLKVLKKRSMIQLFSLYFACYAIGMILAATPHFLNLPYATGLTGPDTPQTGFNAISFFFRFNPVLRLPEFILGIVAGLIFINHRNRLAPHTGKLLWIGGIGILAGLILTRHIPVFVMHNGFLSPFATCLILGLALARENFLACAIFQKLGRASYALYLVHGFTLGYFLTFLKIFYHSAPFTIGESVILFLIYVGISIIVSLAINTYIEDPARKFLVRNAKTPSL
jgi:peptidoglycan/LPS O-acetylase OafA/YrhL